MYSKQTFTYKVTAQSHLQADVYQLPEGREQPAILWLHGGALVMGSRAAIAPEQLATYLDSGYTVVALDYRLAPETKLASIIEDIRDGYQWMRVSLPIDPDRIAVIGHSAGGYLTLMTGFCVEPRPRVLVAFYGYGDIIADWYSRPDPYYRQLPLVREEELKQLVGTVEFSGSPYEQALHEKRWRFYLYCRQNGLWPLKITGHDPVEEANWFKSYCPAHNVTPAYPPTLLLHGDEDTDVPVQQSLQMAEALTRAGVDHELVVLPGQGHGFDHAGLSESVVAEAFERVLRFLETYGMQD